MILVLFVDYQLLIPILDMLIPNFPYHILLGAGTVADLLTFCLVEQNWNKREGVQSCVW